MQPPKIHLAHNWVAMKDGDGDTIISIGDIIIKWLSRLQPFCKNDKVPNLYIFMASSSSCWCLKWVKWIGQGNTGIWRCKMVGISLKQGIEAIWNLCWERKKECCQEGFRPQINNNLEKKKRKRKKKEYAWKERKVRFGKEALSWRLGNESLKLGVKQRGSCKEKRQ